MGVFDCCMVTCKRHRYSIETEMLPSSSSVFFQAVYAALLSTFSTMVAQHAEACAFATFCFCLRSQRSLASAQSHPRFSDWDFCVACSRFCTAKL